MNNKQARLDVLENSSRRLQKGLDRLDHHSNIYSWVRVGIFFAGVLLSALAWFLVGWWLALIGAIITTLLFAIAAVYQRQIDRSITRHKIWLQIQFAQIARIKLEWGSIPVAPLTNIEQDHPFEVDLDITGKHSLLRLVNTATSYEGSQRLCDWLLNPIPDIQTIRKRQQLIQELAPMTIFRDKLLLKSMLASKNVTEQWEGKKLLNWLDSHNSTQSLLPLLFASLGLSILTILLFILNMLAVIPGYWVVTLLIAIIFLFVTKDKRGDLFEDAYFLRDAFDQLGGIFEYLETYRYGEHTNLQDLCKPFFASEQRPTLLLKKIARVATAATLQKNMLLWIVLNVLIPWDFYFAHRFNQYKSQVASHLPIWLDVWFELEALNSLANFAYLNPNYVLPQVLVAYDASQHQPFSATKLGHPLIPEDKKVTNDFTISKLGEIDLITGSNMSGKSTFLRTVGINLCLAFAGGPVSASTFSTSLFRLFTCIKISDSVTENYSYFYAEVRRLKAVLSAVQAPDPLPLFCLIDEIFKGTNNRERRLGSQAYISALAGRNCLGIITTHDLDLVKLADKLPELKNYHFKEDIIDGRMVFDYLLRPGPSPTTNALKIMQMEGLPVESVMDNEDKTLGIE